MHSCAQTSDTDIFESYYQHSFVDLQKTNNQFLEKILQKNHSCAYFKDRSISFLSIEGHASTDNHYASINEFRDKVPLTSYEDYRGYINRIVHDGEKHVLSSDNIIYFSTSSGTTGKMKVLPVITETMKKIREAALIATAIIWRSFPRSSSPDPIQQAFNLKSGKKLDMFQRSKDGTPIGPLSQSFSAFPPSAQDSLTLSVSDTLTLDMIQEITDFETSAFVQLVFALATSNIYSYSTALPPVFIHTVKIIENYFEEMTLCIAQGDFGQSSLVHNHISDLDFISILNQTLIAMTNEYGGETYRLARAEHIRNECMTKGVPGILHRLWPTLIYASTAIGSTFSMYKEEVQFYCGEHLPLINMPVYISSEGPFGSLASIHTDEYFLLPTCAFYEFIREEDVQQDQPKTLLISEIEPEHHYELVCTTETGLIRYRMGDIVNCTRFLSRADDLVALPTEPVDIPRVPLISLAYRVGSLLDVFGEKTNEQHLMNALQETVRLWKEQKLTVDICDFTSYAKLDVFPPKYVIFLELIESEERKIDAEQLRSLQKSSSSDVEEQLCQANEYYKDYRITSKLDPVSCILVRTGTFSTFRRTFLVTENVSPTQAKPHRLLKNERHIQFFYDNRIDNI